jgi:hypothetical protein
MTNRLEIAARAYKEAWDKSREMANAPKFLMGPHLEIAGMKLYAAYPRYTKEQIANECRRCRRMYRVMSNFRASKYK